MDDKEKNNVIRFPVERRDQAINMEEFNEKITQAKIDKINLTPPDHMYYPKAYYVADYKWYVRWQLILSWFFVFLVSISAALLGVWGSEMNLLLVIPLGLFSIIGTLKIFLSPRGDFPRFYKEEISYPTYKTWINIQVSRYYKYYDRVNNQDLEMREIIKEEEERQKRHKDKT